MAKRIIDWSLKGSTLTMAKYIDADTSPEILEQFDIAKIYPEFNKLNEVQQFLIVYGIKQKLADCGSSEKQASEKAILAKAKFQDFIDGKVTGIRTNATGAKENKRLASQAREQSQVVSLDGLQVKKIMFPESFTDEDEAKLQEFYSIMFSHSEKQKKQASKK